MPETNRNDRKEGEKVRADEGQRLGRIVEQEARRVLSESQLQPDPELAAQGWERRFIADARQTQEAVELYRELGYEVRAEPVQADEMGNECDDCQLVMLLEFKTIYTRRP